MRLKTYCCRATKRSQLDAPFLKLLTQCVPDFSLAPFLGATFLFRQFLFFLFCTGVLLYTAVSIAMTPSSCKCDVTGFDQSKLLLLSSGVRMLKLDLKRMLKLDCFRAKFSFENFDIHSVQEMKLTDTTGKEINSGSVFSGTATGKSSSLCNH